MTKRDVVLILGGPASLINSLESALIERRLQVEKLSSKLSTELIEENIRRPSIQAIICSLSLVDEGGLYQIRTEIDAQRAGVAYLKKLKHISFLALECKVKVICFGPDYDPSEVLERKFLQKLNIDIETFAREAKIKFIDLFSFWPPDTSFARLYDEHTAPSQQRLCKALDLKSLISEEFPIYSAGTASGSQLHSDSVSAYNSPPHDWQESMLESMKNSSNNNSMSHSFNKRDLQQLPAGSWWEEDDDALYEEHFGNHKLYRATKRARFSDQQEDEKKSVLESNIFDNLNIWINGCCHNGIDLTDQVIRHGGHIFTTDSPEVTHVVCDQLALSKLKNLTEKRKCKKKYVRSDWIVDSINQGKQLPLGPKYNILPDHNAGNTLDAYIASHKQRITKVMIPTERSSAPVMTQNDREPQSLSKIDPGVLNELPAEILSEFRGSRSDIPMSSAAASVMTQNDRFPQSPSKIDPSVLNELPAEIQSEFRGSRSDIPMSSAAASVMTQNDRFPQSPSKIDPSVLNELPAEIQSEFRGSRSDIPMSSAAAPPQRLQRHDSGIPLFTPASCRYDKIAVPLITFMRRCCDPGDHHVALLLEILSVQIVELRNLEDAIKTLRLLKDTATYEFSQWIDIIKKTMELAQHIVASYFCGARLVLHFSECYSPSS